LYFSTEGLNMLTHLQRLDATLPVLVMTAWGSIDGAVNAMRHGARDYVEKPFDNARLLHVLKTQVTLGQATDRRIDATTCRTLIIAAMVIRRGSSTLQGFASPAPV
jgi:FixJ family two-component response regulator